MGILSYFTFSVVSVAKRPCTVVYVCVCWTLCIEQFLPSSAGDGMTYALCRYILKIGTAADCVVQTVDLQLVVGTDRGHLVMFNLNFLEEGRRVYDLRLGAEKLRRTVKKCSEIMKY